MNAQLWYASLAKPSWAPPSSLFGPVWTVLYILIALSFGAVFIKYFRKELPGRVALPFLLNLIFNLLYSPIQFGLHNNLLASLDILLILGTLAWALVATRRRTPWIAYANIPYLLWVSFATILQLTITGMNW